MTSVTSKQKCHRGETACTMKRATRFSVSLVVVLTLVAVSAESALAATISYLGIDTTTGDAWRSTDTVKNVVTGADPNGDNAYGSDGYYVACRASGGGAINIMSSLPSSYIQSVTAGRSSWAAAYYAQLDDPSQAIGPNVANLPITGLWYADSTGYNDFFTVTLEKDASFVLTTILGTSPSPGYAATGIRVTCSDSVTESASIAVGDGVPAYAFFKLSGAAGQTFTIALTGGSGVGASSGIAFESVPVPEPGTLATGLIGLLAYAWRKRR